MGQGHRHREHRLGRWAGSRHRVAECATASVTGTASGSLHIRRTANVVTLRFISLELNSGSGPVSLCTFATGFKVITSALGALRRQFDQTKLQHIWVDPTHVSWQAEYGSVAWDMHSDWRGQRHDRGHHPHDHRRLALVFAGGWLPDASDHRLTG